MEQFAELRRRVARIRVDEEVDDSRLLNLGRKWSAERDDLRPRWISDYHRSVIEQHADRWNETEHGEPGGPRPDTETELERRRGRDHAKKQAGLGRDVMQCGDRTRRWIS